MFELFVSEYPFELVMFSQLLLVVPNTSAIVSRVWSSTAWLAFCFANPNILPTTLSTPPTPIVAADPAPAASSVDSACVLPATAFE